MVGNSLNGWRIEIAADGGRACIPPAMNANRFLFGIVGSAMVEQETVNLYVAGSSPARRANLMGQSADVVCLLTWVSASNAGCLIPFPLNAAVSLMVKALDG